LIEGQNRKDITVEEKRRGVEKGGKERDTMKIGGKN